MQMSPRTETFVKAIIKRGTEVHLGSTVHRAIRIRLNCVTREGPSHLHALSITSDDNICSEGRGKKKKRVGLVCERPPRIIQHFFPRLYVDDTVARAPRDVVRRGSLLQGKPLKVIHPTHYLDAPRRVIA